MNSAMAPLTQTFLTLVINAWRANCTKVFLRQNLSPHNYKHQKYRVGKLHLYLGFAIQTEVAEFSVKGKAGNISGISMDAQKSCE